MPEEENKHEQTKQGWKNRPQSSKTSLQRSKKKKQKKACKNIRHKMRTNRMESSNAKAQKAPKRPKALQRAPKQAQKEKVLKPPPVDKKPAS